jgi:hypothetical protein
MQSLRAPVGALCAGQCGRARPRPFASLLSASDATNGAGVHELKAGSKSQSNDLIELRKRGDKIVKKLLTLGLLGLMSVLAVSLSLPMWAQDAAATQKKEASAAKKDRLEGVIIRSNKDKSQLTVREAKSHVERNVVYDSATKWTSQEHGSKTVNKIDASDVKDGDRVICMGTWENNGAVLHATLISKRLSH